MRISVSGTACQGKTTLIKDFLKEFPSYELATFDYRKLLEEQGLGHSKGTSKATQKAILEGMVNDILQWPLDKNIIMDRNPIDNIVYSLWAFEHGVGDIDEEFINECIPLVHESMRAFDIIFFIPITKAHKIPISEDRLRETDPEYIKEIDAIFKAINYQYFNDIKNSPFFPEDDSPAIIEVFGPREVRMHMIRQYIDVDGDLIEATGNVMQEMEELLTDQQKALLDDQMEELGLDMNRIHNTKNN